MLRQNFPPTPPDDNSECQLAFTWYSPGSDLITSRVIVCEDPGGISENTKVLRIWPLMDNSTSGSVSASPASSVYVIVTGWPGSTESDESDRGEAEPAERDRRPDRRLSGSDSSKTAITRLFPPTCRLWFPASSVSSKLIAREAPGARSVAERVLTVSWFEVDPISWTE